MNIAVIAAAGRSGKAFVAEALKHGHHVRAGVFANQTLPTHPNLTLVPCDATKPEDLRTLFKDQDAVVSLIGHVKGSPASVQTDAITAAVQVMQELGLRRIVSLTGTGVRFPGDRISLMDRFLNLGVGIVDPARVADGIAHVEVLKKSNLDWTVIRVLKLEYITPRPFALTSGGPAKTIVSREEVAQAILQVLTDSSYLQQAPVISRAK